MSEPPHPAHRPEGPPPDAPAERSGRSVARLTRVALGVTLASANLVGAAVVFVFAAWVLPTTKLDDAGDIILLNAVLAAVYVALTVPFGVVWGHRTAPPGDRWLREDRPPTPEEVRSTLRLPLRITRLAAVLWAVAAVAFTIVNGIFHARLIARVGFTVVLGGVSTCALTYLLCERLTRPILARALRHDDGTRRRLPGVATRSMLAWGLGTGIPVLGLVITGISAFIEDDGSRTQLAATMVALGGVSLVVGFCTTFLGARAIGHPVRTVRLGMERLERGDLTAVVPVDDATELGRLQSGFNRMATGLREREELRDLFGRHVGDDVARLALDRGIDLEGEARDAAVLFVDLVGSTTIAAERPPDEVVALLNRFFAVVIEVVDAHGGWINKFLGDAALAVFGAPGEEDAAAARALAAGRALSARLPREVPEVDAGIGVAAGRVVAGNLGDERRFEYTVIGDPVNVAARLTELAKDRPGRLLASWSTVAAAGAEEARCWVAAGEVELRGRPEPVALADPAH